MPFVCGVSYNPSLQRQVLVVVSTLLLEQEVQSLDEVPLQVKQFVLQAVQPEFPN